MKRFFEKHPPELTEEIALKMMQHKLECAEAKYTKKEEEQGLEYLAELYDMLRSFFEEKNVNPG